MPHQPTYSEITHGFTAAVDTFSLASIGSPFNVASVNTLYTNTETRNISIPSTTIAHTHAQAFGIVLPVDPEESEFYFYSFSAFSLGGLNFIPFVSVAGPSLPIGSSVVPIQCILPSHGRNLTNVTHTFGEGVLQPAPNMLGVIPDASSLVFAVMVLNNSGSTVTTNIRLSMDTRRFDEPRYVTEAR